jgi:hypothetical protein
MPDKHDAITPQHGTHETEKRPPLWKKIRGYCKAGYSKIREYQGRHKIPTTLSLRGIWNILTSDNFANNESMVAIFTALIFLGTVVYSFVAFQQWQAIETSNQVNKISAEAAKDAAETAKRQVEDFEASERADLIIKTYSIGGSIESGKLLQLQCMVVNVGGTYARDISMSEGGGGGDAEPWTFTDRRRGRIFRVPVAIGDIPRPADPGLGETLGPNQSRDCSRAVGPLDSDTMLGKYYAEFSISVSYRDIFGKSYILNDCLMYYPWSKRFSRCWMTTKYEKSKQQ